MKTERLYEDENGYVYPCENGYKVHWKNEKFKPDVNIKFSKHWEACRYLRSVNINLGEYGGIKNESFIQCNRN